LDGTAKVKKVLGEGFIFQTQVRSIGLFQFYSIEGGEGIIFRFIRLGPLNGNDISYMKMMVDLTANLIDDEYIIKMGLIMIEKEGYHSYKYKRARCSPTGQTGGKEKMVFAPSCKQ
jgi:hypothetical protein